MREPLPMPVKTACAYADAAPRSAGRFEPLEKASKEWETDRFSPYGIQGEDGDAAHVQVYGEHAPFEVLLAPPRDDEDWNTEPHRLGRYALRLWSPLLDGAERVGHLCRQLAGPSTSATRCRPGRPCSRRARAPARPGPSARWSRGTSPRAHVTLDEMLIVTFGRAASQELRERVRTSSWRPSAPWPTRPP